MSSLETIADEVAARNQRLTGAGPLPAEPPREQPSSPSEPRQAGVACPTCRTLAVNIDRVESGHISEGGNLLAAGTIALRCERGHLFAVLVVQRPGNRVELRVG